MPLKSHPQEGLSMTLFFPFHGNKASEPHTLVLSTSLSLTLFLSSDRMDDQRDPLIYT